MTYWDPDDRAEWVRDQQDEYIAHLSDLYYADEDYPMHERQAELFAAGMYDEDYPREMA